MKNKLSKKIKRTLTVLPGIFGLAIFPIICTVVDKHNNYLNLELNNLKQQVKETEDVATSLEGINEFIDYNPIYTTPSAPVMNNDIGMVGTSRDEKTIIFTTYSGLIAWSNNLTENKLIKDFYFSKGIKDISNFSIKTMLRVPERRYSDTTEWGGSNNVANGKGLIAVLFGERNDRNQIFFLIDEKTGGIYIPEFHQNNSDVFKSIIFVGDNNEHLYLRGTWKILIFGKGTSKNISTTFKVITFNTKTISMVHAPKINWAIDENDYFVGFSSGYLSGAISKWDFAFFLKESTKKIYVIAIDNNLNPVKNSSNDHIKYEFDIDFTPTSFGSTSIDKDSLLKFAYTRLDGNNVVTEHKPRFVYTIIGENQKTYDIQFNGTSFELKNSLVIPKTNNDKITNVLFNNVNKNIYYVIGSSSNNNTLAYVKLDQTNLSYQVLKSENRVVTKPYIISLIDNFSYKNPQNDDKHAFISINEFGYPEGYYKKDDNTFGDPQWFILSKFDDPVEKIKSDNNIYKNKMPSNILSSLSNNVIKFLDISNSAGYRIATQDGRADDNLGTLSFKYKITYSKWWESGTQDILIPIFIDGFYLKSNISFNFVTSQSIDSSKFNKIENLKKTKYSHQITNEEILHNFFTYKIIDKDKQNFIISEDMIEKVDEGSSLRIKVTLPSSSFPAGIPGNMLTFTHVFTGFKSREGYIATVRDNVDPNIQLYKKQYPSYVKKEDIINSFIDYSRGVNFKKDPSNWNILFSTDDYNGKLTISSIKYDITTDAGTSKETITILNSSKEYTNFYNIFGQIKLDNDGEHKPTIRGVDGDSIGTKRPIDLWNEYIAAVKTGDKNKIYKTTLISSLKFPIVRSLADLNIEATNLDTANNDKKIILKIFINDGAKLNIRHSSSDSGYLKFDNKLKNYFISKGYPFVLEWNVNNEDSQIYWNVPEGASFKLFEKDNMEILEIDLDAGSWQKINRDMTVEEFSKDATNYKHAISLLFNYSDIYEIVYSEPIKNTQLGLFIIRVDFKLKDEKGKTQRNGNDLSPEKFKEIVIKGFKIPVSPIILSIFAVSILVLIIFISLIIYMIAHRSKILKQTYDKKHNKFSKKIVRDKKIIYVENDNNENIFIDNHDEKDIMPKNVKKVIRPR